MQIVNVLFWMQEFDVTNCRDCALLVIWRPRYAWTWPAKSFKILLILGDGLKVAASLFAILLSEHLLVLSKSRGIQIGAWLIHFKFALILDGSELLLWNVSVSNSLWSQLPWLLLESVIDVVIYHLFQFLIDHLCVSERFALSNFVSFPCQPLLLLLKLGDRRYRALRITVSRECWELELGIPHSLRVVGCLPGLLWYRFLQLILLKFQLLDHPLGFRLLVNAHEALELGLELLFPDESRQLTNTLVNGCLSHHGLVLLCSLDLKQL